VIVLAGTDIGEFADLPLRQLESDLARHELIEIFVDARALKAASLEVGKNWALWIIRHRGRFKRISVLTASRYFRITAEFVRGFTGLSHLMSVSTDESAFDKSLHSSVLQTQAR
jgi:hypothetical protein